jgi:hypothetical protein
MIFGDSINVVKLYSVTNISYGQHSSQSPDTNTNGYCISGNIFTKCGIAELHTYIEQPGFNLDQSYWYN